ncbi:MAG: hypothetical protein IKK88_02260 [Oscillospiraceae bacterium]|nr:hypothetical protein [Oscillospiraceae bacterium]
MKDKKLLSLISENPEKGLAETLDMYSAYVMKIVRTRLGDVCSNEDIEETVSDIFMIFFKAVSSGNVSVRSVKAYIAVISQRHCIDVFRKKSRQADTVCFDDISESALTEKTREKRKSFLKRFMSLENLMNLFFSENIFSVRKVRR